MLFSPIKVGPMELVNRLSVPPMDMYAGDNGCVTSFDFAHYGALSMSGAGLLCIEVTAVDPIGRISRNDLGLWDEKCADSFKPLLKMIRDISPIKMMVQIGHAGRKASVGLGWEAHETVPISRGGWIPVAPSPIPYGPGFATPKEMTVEEIKKTGKDFVQAAIRAKNLGFDAVQIHCAHGYLLHQFLSPISNKRTDQYGGSLENRMRFPLEVIRQVREAVSELALCVRISATDWVTTEPSWTVDQSIEFIKEAKKLGIDFVDVSSGGLSPDQQLSPGPGYQVPLARAIKPNCGIPTICVGLIQDPWQAETCLRGGAADMVDIGRAMLFDPHWGWRAARRLHTELPIPERYQRWTPPD
ncbi:MAG: NADH:flavin oxidoreductase/NADH oxidase [Burkholderiales bacterium]|nr:NADH:flavin oxidoreductase/NADH oxidase [Burkholderiales bacterium]